TTNDRRLRNRSQAVLMATRGRKHGEIAEDLLISPRTLQRWLNAYMERGLEGLKIRWAAGKPALIPEDLVPEVREWIEKGPAAYGYSRKRWTYAALAEQLEKTHGIRVSTTTMREFCHRHQVFPYRRSTYRFFTKEKEPRQAANG
ncbi:MAG: helix-turn-helix domain-containing protein, partial [Deltaproteobacteria bacterium]